MIKGSIYQEYIIINLYASHNKAHNKPNNINTISPKGRDGLPYNNSGEFQSPTLTEG
jgi:hypothetical protein